MSRLRSIAAGVAHAATRTLTVFIAAGAPSALAALLSPVLARLVAAARRLLARAAPPAAPAGLSLSRSQLLTSKG